MIYLLVESGEYDSHTRNLIGPFTDRAQGEAFVATMDDFNLVVNNAYDDYVPVAWVEGLEWIQPGLSCRMDVYHRLQWAMHPEFIAELEAKLEAAPSVKEKGVRPMDSREYLAQQLESEREDLEVAMRLTETYRSLGIPEVPEERDLRQALYPEGHVSRYAQRADRQSQVWEEWFRRQEQEEQADA